MSSSDPLALTEFARQHGLSRRDSRPFLHYDVTEEELARLGIEPVSRREFFDKCKRSSR